MAENDEIANPLCHNNLVHQTYSWHPGWRYLPCGLLSDSNEFPVKKWRL